MAAKRNDTPERTKVPRSVRGARGSRATKGPPQGSVLATTAGLNSPVARRRLVDESGVALQIELEMQNEELRRTQAELEATRARYFDLYDLAPVGYCSLDGKGRILEANLTAATLLGIGRSTLVGQSIHSFIAVEDRDRYYLRGRSLIDSREPQSFDLRMVKDDGTSFWAHLTARIGEDDAGASVLRVVLSDETARHQAEAGLLESAERLRLAVQASKIGLWDWDLRTNAVVFSAELKRQFGYDEHEVSNEFSEWERRVHPEDLAPTIERVMRFLAQPEGSQQAELRMRHKDGSWRWIHARAGILLDGEGKPMRMLGGQIDITERRQAEAALRASEVQNRALISAIPDLIFKNRRNGEFVSAHASDPSQLLVPVERLLGRTIEEVLPQPAAGVLMQALTKALESNSIQQITYALPMGGRERLFEARVVPSGSDTVVSIVRDVTERKRAEEALESSLHEKEALLKEVHHRVKNNLQVITSLLRLETARSKEPDARRVLKDMQGRVISMALLHETLYRSGQFGRVDLARYLEELARQLFRAHQMTSGLAQLVLELSPVLVKIDQAIPCGLILNELLTNSLKHAFADGREGELRVALRQEAAGKVRLQVGDNGTGLPADFETIRGNSLGLQLVGDLARQLGGSLEIGPLPSAVFTVTFTPSPTHPTDPTLRPPREDPSS